MRALRMLSLMSALAISMGLAHAEEAALAWQAADFVMEEVVVTGTATSPADAGTDIVDDVTPRPMTYTPVVTIAPLVVDFLAR